ncbi:integral membrane protein DUF106-domain-containing protein [Scheffersomyces xylosifermentans]|uniref:integral membrane protein DUF106-domain-containing protein n=1 Tax=Scheffersomyces xylosifermentans TaxID=1304137 RepID=UPI00315C7F84
MITPDLLLDPQLKYWVLLPISFVMVFIGLLRSNITFLLQAPPKLEGFKAVREKQFLRRAASFKTNNQVLTEEEFEVRKQYFIEKLNSTDFYAKIEDSNQDPMSQLTDPGMNDALMNMAKGNVMNFIPQTVIMAWVNYFFAGFVVMKLPFPLTDGFKSMLQNGIATPDLNVRYVSSISWYFVNLFGLRPVYSLLMGGSEADALMSQQQQQSPLPNIGGPGGPKVDKLFKAEAENIQILSHESVFEGIAERVLESYGV